MKAPERRDLDTAIAHFLEYRDGTVSPGTVTNDRVILQRFLANTGNIAVGSIDWRHYARHISDAKQRRPRSCKQDHHRLVIFFRFCRNQLKWMRKGVDPTGGAKSPQESGMRVERKRVPKHDFPALLDAAWDVHPQVGATVAIGLFLLLRGGETKALKVGDLDLDDDKIVVESFKTKFGEDAIDLNVQFRFWMRRWMLWYAEHCAEHGLGSLQPEWYLIPSKSGHRPRRDEQTGLLVKGDIGILRPTTQLQLPHRQVKMALERIGFPLHDPRTGKSTFEGAHTLRRSGARAWAEELRDQGVRDFIGPVQSLLHHKTRAQTEHYIGMEGNLELRNELLRSGPMYTFEEANVVQLRRRGQLPNG